MGTNIMRIPAPPLAHATAPPPPSLLLRRRPASYTAAFFRQCRRVLLPVTARVQVPERFTSEKEEGTGRSANILLQCGTLMASIAQPAFAVTGSNNNFDDDLISMLIQAGIIAFFYFLVVPPALMNWMRLRWYKRKFFEMYLQFMLVFIFFPGLLLWAPFLNFRKFPRDPSMKYPWSTPSDLNMNSQKLR